MWISFILIILFYFYFSYEVALICHLKIRVFLKDINTVAPNADVFSQATSSSFCPALTLLPPTPLWCLILHLSWVFGEERKQIQIRGTASTILLSRPGKCLEKTQENASGTSTK